MKPCLDQIFCNGMVFASHKPMRIFGKGDGHISVRFQNITAETDSCEGKWIVELPPQNCGGPFAIEINLDGKIKTLSDIYIGLVILLAGQSNIQFKLEESSTPENNYCDCEMLRLFTLERIEKSEFFHPSDGWIKCKKESAAKWSAIGYHTGLELYNMYNCAVGLIACYQGASVIESWLPEGTLERMEINFSPEDLYLDHTYPDFSEWNQAGKLYENMVRKLFPFSLSDVIWYQGESDTSAAEGKIYDKLLAEMIRIWRNDFSDCSLPFLVVQIADLDTRRDDGWKELQKAQIRIQYELPFVKTIISADVCETNDIHPPTKYKLAHRIAMSIKL